MGHLRGESCVCVPQYGAPRPAATGGAGMMGRAPAMVGEARPPRQTGQNTGMRSVATIQKSTFSGPPTRMKSPKRYCPGP